MDTSMFLHSINFLLNGNVKNEEKLTQHKNNVRSVKKHAGLKGSLHLPLSETKQVKEKSQKCILSASFTETPNIFQNR
jgi:hypothetical protein